MILDLLQGISVLAGECFCIVILFWPVLFHLVQTHAERILHTHTGADTHTRTYTVEQQD